MPMPGLSPRVRGNHMRIDVSSEWPRPIPARAGEPRLPSPVEGATRAYPRACGGTKN